MNPDEQDNPVIDAPPATPTDAGPPAAMEVVHGEVVDEGPQRHGLFGTWIPMTVALLLAIAGALQEVGAIDWNLGWQELLPVLIPTLTTQAWKVIQAIVKIRAQAAAVPLPPAR